MASCGHSPAADEMRHAFLIPMLFSATVVAQSETGGEAGSTAASFEGNWIWRSPKTVTGKGGDVIAALRATTDSWTITLTSIYYDGRNTGRASVRGPFDADIRDGVLSYVESGEKREQTIRLENGRLVFPGIVQTDPKTWVFKSTGSRGARGTRVWQFECEFDPLITPVGKAWFPGIQWKGRQQFYVYEQGKRSLMTEPRPSRLRFLVRMKDGTLHDACELVWDQRGTPRFQGDSWYRLAERRFKRLSDSELRKVKEMTEESSQAGQADPD